MRARNGRTVRLVALTALVASVAATVAALSSAAPARRTISAPPAYYPSGPQLSVSESALAAGGWKQCWTGNYNDSSSEIATVLAACPGDYLLLAGGPVASTVFDVVAAAPRTDVIFDTGTGNTPHDANGSGWYYNDSYSWGFAPQGSPINRDSCDIIDSDDFPDGGATDGDHRLCWHTGGGFIEAGWRSGRTDFLQDVDTYRRAIYVPTPTGTITVTKRLVSSPLDPAKFNLRVDGTTYAFNVGNGGTTGAVTVAAGTHTVSETAGTGANLGSYTTRIACSDGSVGYGTSLSGVTVTSGGSVTCTITNTRKLFKT
jgi:hypothetical protein